MLYNIIVLEPFIFFCITCDYMTVIMICDGYVTVCDSHM